MWCVLASGFGLIRSRWVSPSTHNQAASCSPQSLAFVSQTGSIADVIIVGVTMHSI